MAEVIRLVTIVDLRCLPQADPAAVVDESGGPAGPGMAAPGPERVGTPMPAGSAAPAPRSGWSEAPGWAPAPAEEFDPNEMSLRALHQAVLDDGRCLTLLSDRGWTESGAEDAWQHTSIEAIQATARTVVGPDEPSGERTVTEMAAQHWDHLAGVLAQHGVHIDAAALRRLPHEVILGERLRARLPAS